jgi:hypothetical protein
MKRGVIPDSSFLVHLKLSKSRWRVGPTGSLQVGRHLDANIDKFLYNSFKKKIFLQLEGTRDTSRTSHQPTVIFNSSVSWRRLALCLHCTESPHLGTEYHHWTIKVLDICIRPMSAPAWFGFACMFGGSVLQL